MLSLPTKSDPSAVGESKRVQIWLVVRVDVQQIVPCRPYPLGRHADELEHEGFDAACLLQSEGFCVKPSHKELVEVAYHSRQEEEDRVLCHEGLWQPGPSEAVVHVVEDAFLATSEVVELDNLPAG